MDINLSFLRRQESRVDVKLDPSLRWDDRLRIVLIILFMTVCNVSANAAEVTINGSFSDESMVNIAALDAVVSNNNITMSFAQNASMGRNIIQADAFKNTVGINSVNMNSAPSANVQQIVSVNISGVDLSGALPVVEN